MEFLDPRLPSVNWGELTNIMTKNLKDAKAALKDMLQYMLYLIYFVDDDLERWFAT